MLDYIFPTTCDICAKRVRHSQLICKNCYLQLPFCDSHIFRKKELTCYAPYYYSGAIKQLLIELKFGEKLQHTRLLGKLLATCMKQHYSTLPQFIIPVPLHKKRLQQRGFNQALEIAKVISKMTRIPIATQYIERHKATQPQTQCTAAQRELNIKKAFRLKKPVIANHIIVIDDVITTGNTLRECIRCLNQTTIKKIDCWSVAR